MGKRGGDGHSKAKGGKGTGAQDANNRQEIDQSAKPGASPSDAADELGISPDAKPSFVDGAEDLDRELNKPGPGGGRPSPADVLKRWQVLIDIHERRYGRGRARAYSRGGYWVVVKALKTALAVAAVAGIHVPGNGAVNAGMVGAYWASTR